MAQSFREAADFVEIREGGGWLSAFGLPFLAAGIFMCLSAAGILPMRTESGAPVQLVALIFLGALFTLVGGALVFGRAWTTVDASRRLLIKQWGLLWPIRGHAQSLDSCAVVTIGFEHGDSDSADQFPVLLTLRDRSTLKACSFADYASSRACAAAIGSRLKIDLVDASTDHVQQVAPGQASLSFAQRARRDERRDESGLPPPAMRSTVDRDGRATRIVIPNPPRHPIVLVFVLVPLAAVLWFTAPLGDFFRQTRTPDPVGRMFLGFLMFLFGVLPGSAMLTGWLRSRVGRTIVTASSEGVVIQERGIWSVKTQKQIAASDILDVDYSTRQSTIDSARRATELRVLAEPGMAAQPATIGPRTEQLIAFVSRFAKGSGITVKTRQGFTTFGAGLADDEIQYLHGVVRRALIG